MIYAQPVCSSSDISKWSCSQIDILFVQPVCDSSGISKWPCSVYRNQEAGLLLLHIGRGDVCWIYSQPLCDSSGISKWSCSVYRNQKAGPLLLHTGRGDVDMLDIFATSLWFFRYIKMVTLCLPQPRSSVSLISSWSRLYSQTVSPRCIRRA